MSSKLSENEHGLTYTLEAILGAILIISTVLFFSNSLPYVAQKTGEHSKVQLMNIGRDNLDLIEVTPVVDISPGYWAGLGLIYRNYTLVADKKFVEPGENVTFTVYTLGYTEILYHNLTLRRSVLGLDTEANIGIINGTMVTNFSSVGDYNVRAVELVGNKDDVLTWSNYVTIKVGHYFLDTNITGISTAGDMNVSGVVYNSTGSGVPGLDIEILNHEPTVIKSHVSNTTYGIIVDDCENFSLWTSSGTLRLNSTNVSNINESHSISVSVNSDSSFWLKKTISTTYNFDQNDILSFYFFSINKNETIDVELSNSSDSVTGKLTWDNTNSLNLGWNKINAILKYPHKAEGNVTVEDADTIEIKVSNITNSEYYLFDSLIAGEGRFSFIWPPDLSGGGDAGSYYIQAKDSNGNVSNRHRIIFADGGLIDSDKYVIYEGDSTNIRLLSNDASFPDLLPINIFNINTIKYLKYDENKIHISEPIDDNDTIVTLTAYTAGDYYIFYGETGGQDPAAATKTNTILIHVLPADGKNTLYSDSNCGGINITQLNDYMRLNMPPYVNYNLYLINPDGTLCDDCPEFKEMINGYPTGEAVVVNKLIHLNQGSGLGFMRELRMVLWYK
ncbi:MAG: hypothetical protein K8R08_03325 [Methanosarcinales archaeon]|nr:hypothetical protein [Methanosarcinales archaeon]